MLKTNCIRTRVVNILNPTNVLVCDAPQMLPFLATLLVYVVDDLS